MAGPLARAWMAAGLSGARTMDCPPGARAHQTVSPRAPSQATKAPPGWRSPRQAERQVPCPESAAATCSARLRIMSTDSTAPPEPPWAGEPVGGAGVVDVGVVDVGVVDWPDGSPVDGRTSSAGFPAPGPSASRDMSQAVNADPAAIAPPPARMILAIRLPFAFRTRTPKPVPALAPQRVNSTPDLQTGNPISWIVFPFERQSRSPCATVSRQDRAAMWRHRAGA